MVKTKLIKFSKEGRDFLKLQGRKGESYEDIVLAKFNKTLPQLKAETKIFPIEKVLPIKKIFKKKV